MKLDSYNLGNSFKIRGTTECGALVGVYSAYSTGKSSCRHIEVIQELQ